MERKPWPPRLLLAAMIWFGAGIAAGDYAYRLFPHRLWALAAAMAVALLPVAWLPLSGMLPGAVPVTRTRPCPTMSPGCRTVIASLAVVTALGEVWAWWHLTTGPSVLAPWADRMARVEGVVSRGQDERQGVTYLVVRVVKIDGRTVGHRFSPGRLVRLAVKGEGPVPRFGFGDLIEFSARLRTPEPPGNPGQFDYPRYLASQGIWYTASAAAPDVVIARRGPPGLARLALAMRDLLAGTIRRQVPGPQGPLVQGLIFGGGQDLPEDVQADFRRAGVYHILAVSGSNVAFVAGGAAAVLRLLRVGARGRAPLVSLVIALYALMTGLGASVLRASVMALAILLAKMMGERSDALTGLGVAGMAQLVANPLALYDAGFQLSFAATAGILLFYRPMEHWLTGLLRRWPPGVLPTLAATLAAQAGVAPVSLWHFSGVSVISLAANLMVVPVAGFLVTYGTVASLAGVVWPAAGLVLQRVTWLAATGLMLVADWASRVPGGFLWLGRPSPVLIAAFYLSMWWLWRPSGGTPVSWRWWLALSLFVSGTLVLGTAAGGGPGVLRVTVLDVGEGDSIVIAPPGGPWLLLDGGTGGGNGPGDTGGGMAGASIDRGKTVVVPFLHFHGVSRLGDIIVSHGHEDHAGGLRSALAEVSVRAVWTGGAQSPATPGPCWTPALAALQKEATHRHVPFLHPEEGLTLHTGWAGRVLITFLHTTAGCEDAADVNDTSLVVKVSYGRVSFLLTGDLGIKGEQELLQGSEDISATVLKVGHHGSTSSTSAEFLAAVTPEVAVISVGQNLYGHPAAAVLRRLRDAGVQVWRTDEAGALTIATDGRRLWVRPYRRVRQDSVSYPAKSFGEISRVEMIAVAGVGSLAPVTARGGGIVVPDIRQ